MDVRVLGPLEVLRDGQALELGAAKQRTLLAVLLLSPNRVVSTDHLIEALWGERPPPTAQKALQVYVSRLRKVLGRDRILTRVPGYQLRLDPGELDSERFDELVARGALLEALALWRGPAFADFAYEPFAQAEIARLEEGRLACIERRIAKDLELGRHSDLVPELERLVREHPVRERMRGQLMLALYRSGRQADALDAYQAGRNLLASELGLEPGAELKELQRQILGHESTLGPPDRASPSALEPGDAENRGHAPDRPREGRKTVTVLSCELTPRGEELDPESVGRITARAFDELLPVLEAHAATLERPLDGSVSAIFGVPVVHEDDALRSARAAVEIRDRLDASSDLSTSTIAPLELRVGIATGEVLVDATSDRPLATGQPIQSAVRLRQAAVPGELLVDERTYALIRDAADVEWAGSRGRLVGVSPVALERVRRFDSPMVGREREKRRLHDAYEQAVGDRTCQLFTIIGAPGVGKSRLVREFVQDVSGGALIARGRCLAYGDGITYWPVLEVVRDIGELDDAAPLEASVRKLVALLGDGEDARFVAERLGGIIGSDRPSSTDETTWAVRAFFEMLARRKPLVIVFDDIHWGEPTFLELVDNVADWTSDAPLLLVCIARPELLDARPHWGGGKANATSVRLEPLSEIESATLLRNLAGPELPESARQRVIQTAGGNPLFVEEMLALLLDGGDPASTEMPASIHALLAARLDRLPDEERSVLEAAAVEGKVFHEASVAELTLEDAQRVHETLLALVRRDLIRPERPVFSWQRAFRFRHLLIRDVAYDTIPKETRAGLHERHASWLEGLGERALELEEIIGYHLEQAFRYRTELEPRDEATAELAARAGRRLGLAGRRALARGDTPAALSLTSRAAALLPSHDPLRVHVVPGVRIAQGMGDELQWADSVLSEAIASDDVSLQTHARVQRSLLHLFTGESVDVEQLASEAEDAIRIFGDLGDELGLARAWRLRQQARYLARQSAASADAASHALRHARAAADELEEVEIIDWLAVALFMGATPASEAERRVASHLEQLYPGHPSESVLLACRAGLTAMQGRLVEARPLIDRARQHPLVDEPEYVSRQYVVSFHLGWTELLADNPAGAERTLRAALAPLEAVGDTSGYSAIVALLAEAVYILGDPHEAEQLTRTSESAAQLNDVFAMITWRRVRAKTLARRGEFRKAEKLATETVAFAAGSDFLNAHGEALIDLAEILELAGRRPDAAAAVEQALSLFETKENTISAARAAARLEALRSTD